MAQRIKIPARSDRQAVELYTRRFSLMHEMLVYSIKAKQSTHLANVEKLRALLSEFHEAHYAEQEGPGTGR